MWASGWFSTSDLWFVSPPAHLPYTSAAAQGRSTIPSTGDTARLDSQECAPPAINPPASIAMPIFEAISGGPPTYHAWICRSVISSKTSKSKSNLSRVRG